MEDQDQVERYSMYSTGTPRQDPYHVTLQLNGQAVAMEVNTGASVTVICKQTFRKMLKSTPKITPSNAKLNTYTGKEIRVLGTIKVPVQYKDQRKTLSAVVVAGKSPNLLGRNWHQVFATREKAERIRNSGGNTIESQKLNEVFLEGLGTFKVAKAKIVVDVNASPKYCKARPVPYVIRQN